MEDIKKRLELKNNHVQIKTLWKLYSEVTKSTKQNGMIKSAKSESPELKLLWQKCSVEKSVISGTASQVLLELVLNKSLEYGYVYQSLINIVPSARSLYGIVSTLTQLLTIQALDRDSTSSRYTCPFSIRNPTHPLIIIATNRPECWNVITQQVDTLFHHSDTRVRCLANRILKPFLQFLFLEPQQTPAYQQLRHGIQEVLLGVIGNEDESANEVEDLLVTILPGLQIKTPENLGFSLAFLTQTVQKIHPGIGKVRQEVPCALLVLGLTVIKPCLKKGLHVITLLRGLVQMLEGCQTIDYVENIILLSSDLLMVVDYEISDSILRICKIVLGRCQSTNPLTKSVLLLPLLQLLSIPTEQPASQQIKSLTSHIISQIEQSDGDSKTHEKKSSPAYFTDDGHETQIFANLLDDFHHDPEKARKWLQNILNSIGSFQTISMTTSNMVAALFVSVSDYNLKKLTLELLVEIAKADNSQAPNFLSLLLYELGRNKEADSRLLIMEFVPLLARHKVCIGPILKTIQMFSTSIKLQPLAIRLLVHLWQIQDRCYPHLIKLVTEPSSNNNVIIAQALAIKEICHLRPEQHGEDLLAPVSDILNKCSDVTMVAAAALALEALYMLCEAEVIDIKSAWNVLAVKLSTDSRPAVIEKICELFALVPNLAVDNPEYEDFMNGVVDKLWEYSQSENAWIQGAAYQALASYNLNQFYIDQLPKQVTQDIREEIEKKEKSKEDEDISYHVPVLSICYIRILQSISTRSLKDYGVFLSGIVGKEVDELPRGIYHSSLRRQTAISNQGKAISNIPAFILSEYEKTKQPGLRPSLAVSLLFCYDPPIEVGRDGRPRRHYVITHGKNYQQFFQTLLHEVPIQPSEWHRCMLLPQGWTSFIDRLYSSLMESRKVEIDSQVRQGQLDDEEAKKKLSTNWLWIRDELTEIIKKTSRNNPSMQGNSVLALSGLAVAVTRHVKGLDKEDVRQTEELGQHVSHSHWLVIVMDTIMSIMDVSFQPKGEIFNMCLQGEGKERKPATLLARTSSCMALTQLVPVLMSTDTDRIHAIIVRLVDGLPGQPGCQESPVAQFHYGLACGMLIGRLFEEHFSEICGSKALTQLWKSLNILEDTCFNTELENRSGCILGLGLAISGLSQDSQTDSRVHVTDIIDKIMVLFHSTDVNHSSYQAVCVSMACIAGSAFINNIITSSKITSLIDTLYQTHQQYPQMSGVSLALGMMCYNLMSLGHTAILKLYDELIGTWLTSIQSHDTSPLIKVSILNGLLAMIGSERTLIATPSSARSSTNQTSTNEIVKMASKVISTSTDIGIQGNAAWMLGHLYLSACAVTETRASVPPNYSYLKETSMLRGLVDFLLEAGKHGPEKVKNEELKIVLKSLQDEVSRSLPPLNWAGVLSPLMRMEYVDEIKCLCIKLAVTQCTSSPTAASFISSWLQPTLFSSLSDDSRLELFKSLPLILKPVQFSVLKIFLEKCCMVPFSITPVKSAHCVAVLEGLNKALLVHDPPKSVTLLLYEATENLYKAVTDCSDVQVLTNLSKCLFSIPDDRFDTMTAEDFSDSKTFIKGVFIRCQLVAMGRQPIVILNSCLDATINDKTCDYKTVFSILCHCFYTTVMSSTESTGTMYLVQWLLELVGHVRNISMRVIQLDDNALPLSIALELLVGVVSAAISIWTKPSLACMINIDSKLLISDVDSETKSTQIPNVAIHHCLQALPVSIVNLNLEPWLQILPKIVNWMVSTLEMSDDILSIHVRKSLKDSLYLLRDSEEFKKAAVWTQVFTLDQ